MSGEDPKGSADETSGAAGVGKEVGVTGSLPPKDDQLFTPQGGGGGTGSMPMGPPPDSAGAPGGIALPQVGSGVALGPPGDGAERSTKGGEREVSSLRLILTLAVAGGVAGALLVFVFLWSQPQIQAYDARVLQEAVVEVLRGPDHFESVFVHEGTLLTADRLPQGVDTMGLDKVFLGYDQAGEPVGFALQAEGFGFQDIIRLIFGYNAATNQVIGMKVLRHLETPGLGDKIVKDLAFVGEFEGVEAPIEGVKPDRNTGDADQVDMITGATISSKAVIRIINDRISEMGHLLAAYQPTGGVQEGDR